MTTVDKYCATCSVRWNPVSGFSHTIDCPQYMKQESAEVLDHVDYTPPKTGIVSRDYKDGYTDGWNDALGRVMELCEGIGR